MPGFFKGLLRRLLGDEPTPKAKLKPPFRIRVDSESSIEYDVDFISLPSDVWDGELNPRAAEIAERRDRVKAALAAVRGQRKATKIKCDAVRRELAAQDKSNYKQQKADHERYLLTTREEERCLLTQKEEIRLAWHSHYADIKDRRMRIFHARESATREALMRERRWHYFLFPGECVRAVRAWQSDTYPLGMQTVLAGSVGMVTAIASLMEGRYTFQMIFDRHDEALCVEYDLAIHGEVLTQCPSMTSMEPCYTELRAGDPRAKFLIELRLNVDPNACCRPGTDATPEPF